MNKVAQIKLLIERGYSRRAVSRALKVSSRTIARALGERQQGLSEAPAWLSSLDWSKISDEIHRRGTSIKQLHREMVPDVNYLAFWRAVRTRCPVEQNVTMRLVFKPGERTQIDFTDGIAIFDRSKGGWVKTQLFVGVLAFSSRIFGEFVANQKLATFIAVQDRMWHYFGGVTPYVVLDNLKSGVTHADLYDPDVNPTYTDYANHMGFAALPARPYHPRDKAKGESNINVIQRQFYQEVRDRVFYSLNELNQSLREFLGRLDVAVMKDHGISRMDRFKEEAHLLKPLPVARFEICEWRLAKVHPDCHIQVMKNFYSVPFRHVGKEVRVRLGERMVEIFDDAGTPIAAHSRHQGTGKTITNTGHYPEHKVQVASFAIGHAKTEASTIGTNMRALVDHLLDGSYPLKHLRRVQGILRLSKSIERESLDYAAAHALRFDQGRVAYIRSCALFHQKNGGKPVALNSPSPKRERDHIHLQTDNGGKKS